VLSALTTNVYAVPFVNPVTTMLDILTPVATTEPGLDVTLYVTPAAPAVPAAPCVHVTVASAFPAVAVPIVGADGATPITSEGLDEDAADSTPFEEMDVTVKVTVLPAVSPDTTIGLDAPVFV
jgi:hypothetical protein